MYKNNNCSANNYKIASGNSMDLRVGECESEIRADVTVNELNSIRLWGRVINCNGAPVPNALVKLIKIVSNCSERDYIGIAHTITDCEGFYQFELSNCPQNECFKILVSKSAYGPERVLDTSFGNCDPCMPPQEPCQPCDIPDPCQFDSCSDYKAMQTPISKYYPDQDFCFKKYRKN